MLKPIKTEGQYNEALARIYDFMHMDIQDNSPEEDELQGLGILIEVYEKEHYPIPKPN